MSTPSTNDSLICFRDVSIGFRDGHGVKIVVHNLNAKIHPGEVLSIVGESGSGKSVTSLASMGLLPQATAVIPNGTITFQNQELPIHDASNEDWYQLRGNDIAMIFQDPMSSLNPSIRVGDQVVEMMAQHQIHENDPSRKQKTLKLFEEVEIPEPEAAFNKFPHEMSGGQKQRVMIAMALAASPKLLIADEPTTALDVSVQKSVLELFRSIIDDRKLGLIFISHDLDVVKHVSDKIMVMYQGKVVEEGNATDIYNNPKHPYTKGLFACKPPKSGKPYPLLTVSDLLSGKQVAQSTIQKPDSNKTILEAKDIHHAFVTKRNILGKVKESYQALQDISFNLYQGETLGLVGESGCGKSTLGKVICGLITPNSGILSLKGQNLNVHGAPEHRRAVQMIFQDPFSALNPRITVGKALTEVMQKHLKINSQECKLKAENLLKEVGLKSEDFHRYPHSFSGGQRQRIVIARTLAMDPEVVICDESVSALDVSVQAQILNLLNRLKMERGLTYLFISHDLGVVRYMSDRIMVMQKGRVVEVGDADRIIDEPQDSYTQRLVSASF